MKINFGGKDRGFQWGMGCLQKYCELMDCNVEGLDMVLINGKDQIKAATSLILAAMLNYSDLHEEITDYKYSDVQVWLDEAPQETYNSLMEDFKKSKYLGRSIEEYFAMDNSEPTGKEKKN
jgi:predicted PolB exonuclease-like 3'-5' exonuclease